MIELYRKHRPKKFSKVVGQTDAVNMLQQMVKKKKIPHCLLFHGPSGCGKTTLARIVASKLDCGDKDFKEINSADFRGIDMVREIRMRIGLKPMNGSTRVWLIDECHKLSNDAQNAILKVLEDPPDHVYFLLCTTEPHKLLKTVRSRSTEIKCVALRPSEIEALVLDVAAIEKRKLSADVCDKIVAAADGSARKALVILHQIIDLESEDDQLEAISKADADAHATKLYMALLLPRPKWKAVSEILTNIEEEPETIRRIILACCTTTMVKGGKLAKRAFEIANVMQDNFFDSGKAGLVSGCFELVFGE